MIFSFETLALCYFKTSSEIDQKREFGRFNFLKNRRVSNSGSLSNLSDPRNRLTVWELFELSMLNIYIMS